VQVKTSPRRGYHVASGIAPLFLSTYKPPNYSNFFDRGFLWGGTNPIVKKQNNKNKKLFQLINVTTTAVPRATVLAVLGIIPRRSEARALRDGRRADPGPEGQRAEPCRLGFGRIEISEREAPNNYDSEPLV
jgi:hypothetical protein